MDRLAEMDDESFGATILLVVGPPRVISRHSWRSSHTSESYYDAFVRAAISLELDPADAWVRFVRWMEERLESHEPAD
jgi:hypothetical protein